MQRLRVGVIYGGRSSEHEVSLASAASIFSQLDPARYDPVPVHIDRAGGWTVPEEPPATRSAGAVIRTARADGPARGPGARAREGSILAELDLDVVFPIVHGPGGEDGTLQGLLEMLDLPYVGAGVLGSAVAMDKSVSKVLLAAHGLPVVPYEVVRGVDWDADPDAVVARLDAALDYPRFVKPANLGSSIGVSRARDATELHAAIADAYGYDDTLVIETAVPDPREIECSVMGNDAPEASMPGEVIPAGDFYDYEAKYLDDRSQVIAPAQLSDGRITEIRAMAVAAYRALGLAGMARVDFLLDETAGRLYVNEANTLPGFTTISQYPRMWEASGVAYPELLDRLIGFALDRHARRRRLRRAPTRNVGPA